MRREYIKALKQLNDLDEYDKQKVIESYAKLEVSIMDEQFGIENENNNEKDDLWDFVFEFRDMLEEDSKLLDNYVAVEKEKVLAKKDIDEDVPIDLNEIIMGALNLKKDLHNHGEECFESCSDAQIHSVADLLKYGDEEQVNIRNYNPTKYDLMLKLLDPYNKSVRKIADSDVTLHEKRKTMQKTYVGESVVNFITDVILPYLKSL